MAARKPLCPFAEFVSRGLVLVEAATSTDLVPIRLYGQQARFARDVWDTTDRDGRRRFRRAVFSTVKKGGKTSFAALQGVYHLLFDTTERRREIVSISGDQDQARLVMRLGAEMIRRSPALSGFGIELLRDQIRYVDEDGEEHTWIVLASDAVTAHGLNPSLVTVDEVWLLKDYALLEAVALGPQRFHPLTLYTTYAGLKSDQVKGHPLWDLYCQGTDGSDDALYFSWRSGLEAYDDFPPEFIRPGYLDQQRRALPDNRFRRLHLNEWSDRDVGFLSDVEIARAVDATLAVPERSSTPTVLAIDYGRVRDHTAIVACQRHPVSGKVAVVHAETLQGSHAMPVSVSAVERAVFAVCDRLHVTRIIADPYQTVGLSERIADRLGWLLFTAREGEEAPRHDGVVVLQPFTSAYINHLATSLLSLFRDANIAIPGNDPGCQELIEQLGAVVSKETYYGIRIDSGRGVGVRAHDDLVIALGMASMSVAARTSYIELPVAFGCPTDLSLNIYGHRDGYKSRCFLYQPHGGRVWPLEGIEGSVCRKHCRGWQALKAAHDQAVAAGETIDVHTFNRDRIYRPPAPAAIIQKPWWM